MPSSYSLTAAAIRISRVSAVRRFLQRPGTLLRQFDLNRGHGNLRTSSGIPLVVCIADPPILRHHAPVGCGSRELCSHTSCCDLSGESPDDGRFPVRPSSLIPNAGWRQPGPYALAGLFAHLDHQIDHLESAKFARHRARVTTSALLNTPLPVTYWCAKARVPAKAEAAYRFESVIFVWTARLEQREFSQPSLGE